MYKDYRNDFSTTSASRLVDKTTYGIQKDKQQLEKNYDLKFDSKLRSGFSCDDEHASRHHFWRPRATPIRPMSDTAGVMLPRVIAMLDPR